MTKSIDDRLNHLFRQESGKMVSVLTKIFGTENFEMAEDVVQDALIIALQTWKIKGIPDNPKAWLYRVAKNKAIDLIRKNKYEDSFDFSDSEKQLLTSEYTLATTIDLYWEEDQIKDDFLGMMFAVCHPEISIENQSTFMLKSLCGFSTKEIAKSYICAEDTISKRIYRTKEFFRKRKIKPVIPSTDELDDKLAAVLNTIYLVFNEGYNSTHSNSVIREDLIHQSITLCNSLLSHSRTRLPQVFALMSLMHFHAARSASRLSLSGEIVTLAKQNRKLWDQEIISLGYEYLMKSSATENLSQYHVEAAIASEHCRAETFEKTNWKSILYYYDILLKFGEDPVVLLNRCLVTMQVDGPERAFDELKKIDSTQLSKYYLYHAVRGTIFQKLGDNDKAVKSYIKAISLTHSRQEKRLLNDKIDALS